MKQKSIKFFSKYSYDILVGIVIVAFAVWAYLARDAFEFISSEEDLRDFVTSFGPAAPLIFILVIVLEVVVAPIPGFIPAIASGFIFGSFFGSLYTYIGSILGNFLVFFLTRKFGRPLAIKFFKEEKIKKYELAVKRRENLLLAFYFFPLLPLDIITAVFGLSAVPKRKFIFVTAIGYAFYSIILNQFGDFLAVIFLN